jgi:hypothetical protein
MRHDGTNEGAMTRLSQIVAKLALQDLLSENSLIEYEKFVKANNEVNGVAQPNMKWSDVNIRGGFENTVPGITAELIAQANVGTIVGKENITIPQDKQTQHDEKIDFVVNGVDTYQVKSFCYKGQRAIIDKKHTKGIAKFIVLVDIDDKLCYVVDREVLEQARIENKGYFYPYNFEEIWTHQFNNKDLY